LTQADGHSPAAASGAPGVASDRRQVIGDDLLAALLQEVLDAAEDLAPSF
jgi:hypothetical protein